MSTQLEKKRKATVQFTGTSTGKLDESAIDKEEHTLSDHYLFGEGENKGDYSYAVVDADMNLRRGNLDSAWSLGARGGVSEDDLKRRLKALGEEFGDSNPIPDDAYGEESIAAERFERGVEFKQTDSSEQIATGAVLVPDELDSQLDYFRGDTIRDLAENYEQRFENGDVYGGVMHSVFPEGVELVESRVLDESESVGDEAYPEGTWLQSYKFTDDALWSLVDDGVLSGNSIGGTAKGRVTEPIPDDVRVPDAVADGVPDDADVSDLPGREITEGRILEVSAVDQPAVPRATHEQHKAAGLEKGHPALTESVVQARLYLEGRGHSPDDAKRLAEYLQSEKSAGEDAEKSGSWISRARQFFGASSGGSGGESALQQSRAPDESGESTDSVEKDGRTLSQANVASAKAVHDTALDLLDRSDVDHSKGRFTDDPADGFSVGDYGASGAVENSEETAAAESAADADDGDIPMEKQEMRTMIGDVVDEKLDDGDGQNDEEDETPDEEAPDEESSDLEEIKTLISEIKTMLSEMQPDDGEAVEDAADGETDDIAELKSLVEQMADANGVSQQVDVSDTERENEKAGESLDSVAGLLG